MSNEKDLLKLIKQKSVETDRYKELVSLYQSKLQSNKTYYENILALMPGHVYWMNRDNAFLGCNNLQAQHAGLSSRHEIIGKRNSDMMWKNQAKELDDMNSKVMETGENVTVEEFAVMMNGPATYLTHKIPLRNDKNEIIGLLGISLDITDRKRLEKNLTEAIRSKTTFLSIASHEIKGPLSNNIYVLEKIEKTILEDPSKTPALLPLIRDQLTRRDAKTFRNVSSFSDFNVFQRYAIN